MSPQNTPRTHTIFPELLVGLVRQLARGKNLGEVGRGGRNLILPPSKNVP